MGVDSPRQLPRYAVCQAPRRRRISFWPRDMEFARDLMFCRVLLHSRFPKKRAGRVEKEGINSQVLIRRDENFFL